VEVEDQNPRGSRKETKEGDHRKGGKKDNGETEVKDAERLRY